MLPAKKWFFQIETGNYVFENSFLKAIVTESGLLKSLIHKETQMYSLKLLLLLFIRLLLLFAVRL